MKHTLTLFTVLLLAPLAALHAAEPPPAQQTPATAFLYEPTPGLGMPGVESKGLIADVIPYFWNGQFHLMHLQLNPGQKGWDWAQLVTRDFVDFKDTGVAIPGGGTEDAIDLDIFTGSVFEKDGVVHAFYCGHNPALEKQKKPDQVMLHATSRDKKAGTGRRS